jgi:hypothetical protein
MYVGEKSPNSAKMEPNNLNKMFYTNKVLIKKLGILRQKMATIDLGGALLGKFWPIC